MMQSSSAVLTYIPRERFAWSNALAGAAVVGLVALVATSMLTPIRLAAPQAPHMVMHAAPHRVAVANAVVAVPKKVVAPKTPSVFDQEAAMAPHELLQRWDPFVAAAAKRFNVPAVWIRAVMRMESGGRTMLTRTRRMTSIAGAMGIMQVMPETYREMRAQYGLGADAYDPHDNVFAGTAYLRFLHLKYGYPAMFAAYNAGPGTLESEMQGNREFAAETVAYIARIADILDGSPQVKGEGSALVATLTRPDGSAVAIEPFRVVAIRAPLPGEYADGVHAVVTMGKMHQGVRETLIAARSILRSHGSRV